MSMIRERTCVSSNDVSRDIPERIFSADVRVSYGPMEIGIQVNGTERGVRKSCEDVDKKARLLLDDVKRFHPLLKLRGEELRVKSRWPRVVQRMVEAVQVVSAETLTPMAAVAGAISDELLLDLQDAADGFLTKVLVNNGGDMALFSPDEPVRVGIRGAVPEGMSMREVLISEVDEPYGLATSGWRGRSFSQGIADAVVVAADSGALADAAATFVGNYVKEEGHGRVRRRKASELDPMTDIPNLMVTVSCDQLSEGEKLTALENGGAMASSLLGRGIIWGAGIYLQGESMELSKGVINFK